ncbi:hypothetical protein N7465_005740 [Penicillium sp. CMV-2018d]|nr:hypothetical protein N7465_005740 [Penicillium sp. CMV-2018d]
MKATSAFTAHGKRCDDSSCIRAQKSFASIPINATSAERMQSRDINPMDRYNRYWPHRYHFIRSPRTKKGFDAVAIYTCKSTKRIGSAPGKKT